MKAKERSKKKTNDPDTFREKERDERKTRRENEREKDPEKFKLKLKEQQQQYRSSKVDSAFKRKKAFLAAIRNGRIYFCVCCHRRLHENSVLELHEDWQKEYEEQYPGSINKFIGTIPSQNFFIPCLKTETPQKLKSCFICHTCKNYVEKNKMPPLSNQNNLQLVDVSNHPELKLSELEQQLISLNLIFQKIVLLPKSRMSAMRDKTVSVPLSPADITETLTKLPRTPSDARLAIVQLKRRLNFPGVHNQQLIDIRKVMEALKTLITTENPHYKNILEDLEFKQRCLETDFEGYKILFPNEDVHLEKVEIESQTAEQIDFATLNIDSNDSKTETEEAESANTPANNEKIREAEEEEKEYLEKDPLSYLPMK